MTEPERGSNDEMRRFAEVKWRPLVGRIKFHKAKQADRGATSEGEGSVRAGT